MCVCEHLDGSRGGEGSISLLCKMLAPPNGLPVVSLSKDILTNYNTRNNLDKNDIHKTLVKAKLKKSGGQLIYNYRLAAHKILQNIISKF